jgi:hypothetical protein
MDVGSVAHLSVSIFRIEVRRMSAQVLVQETHGMEGRKVMVGVRSGTIGAPYSKMS